MNTETAGTLKAGRERSKRGGAIAATAALSLLLPGCTSLSVIPDRVVSQKQTGMALSGAPYALPMLQYELEVTRILSACPQPVEIPGKLSDGKFWRDELAVELGATAKPTQIAGERYLVNYSKLDGWLKTTNFAIEYQPGTDILKGINVSVADQSGEVTANLVKAGLTVAAVASGVPGAAAVIPKPNLKAGETASIHKMSVGLNKNIQGLTDRAAILALNKAADDTRNKLIALVDGSSDDKTIIACHPSVMADIANRKLIAEKLKEDAEALKVKNLDLEKRIKVAEVGGLNADGRNKLGETLDSVTDFQNAIAGRQVELAEIEKRLGATKKTVWPESFADRTNADLAPIGSTDKARLVRLLKISKVKVIDEQELANRLAASSEDLESYRSIAGDFVDRYVDSDGNAKVFEKRAAPEACSNADPNLLNTERCIAGLTRLAAELKAAASGVLPA